jgi:hypothetical protein
MINPPFPGNNNPTKRAYNGSFAPQEKKGIISLVIFLLLSLSSVLTLIIAGTEHPKPVRRGKNALPEIPSFLMGLSNKKATLAIYPLSSKKISQKNKHRI